MLHLGRVGDDAARHGSIARSTVGSCLTVAGGNLPGIDGDDGMAGATRITSP